MPLLDVSSIILDPDFCERFTVRRRTQEIDDYGRGNLLVEDTQAVGVITAGPSASMQRTAEYGATSRAITVHCKFRLRDTSDGLLPDLILWLGTYYIVDRVQDYSRFGAGGIGRHDGETYAVGMRADDRAMTGFVVAECSPYEETQNAAELGVNHMKIERYGAGPG